MKWSTFLNPWSRNSIIGNAILKGDWENKIKPYSEKHGAKTFGAVGTCWGSYVVLRLAEFVEFQAGVSFHPSHSKIAEILQENEEEILKVRKPQKQFVFECIL